MGNISKGSLSDLCTFSNSATISANGGRSFGSSAQHRSMSWARLGGVCGGIGGRRLRVTMSSRARRMSETSTMNKSASLASLNRTVVKPESSVGFGFGFILCNSRANEL